MLAERHRQEVEEIRAQLTYNQSPPADHKGQWCLGGGHLSNTIRQNDYRVKGKTLSIQTLNRVLDVDVEKRVVIVEPRVTMEKLVSATLPYGYIPAVLPEFKGITVGGAIMGAALESSSHRYGQFNDCCRSMEILLGNGEIIKASSKENSDLFFGISGSYGTLGIILSAEIALVPAEPWVELTYRRFNEPGQAIKYMGKIQKRGNAPDFIEALVYSAEETIVIEGRMRKELPKEGDSFSLKSSKSQWFYCHVKEAMADPKISQRVQFLPIIDYLFRHDRGAFWMGAYALHLPLLASFTLQHYFPSTKNIQNWLLNSNSNLSRQKYPGSLFRGLFGSLMSSQTLYKILHKGTQSWFGERFVIQDFYLKEEKAEEFINEVLKLLDITPLWLCPIKGTSEPQFLAPHQQPGLLFDIGIYGFPKKGILGREATILLEKLACELGGRKMLYTYSNYSEEDFWKIYPQDLYKQLRIKYKADGILKELTEKVLQKSFVK